MMVGIAVTVIDASSAHAAPCYRIWCDGTYGAYLWDTLLEIAIELGGGAVGLRARSIRTVAIGNERNRINRDVQESA